MFQTGSDTRLVIRALKGGSDILNLDNHLSRDIPPSICLLKNIRHLSLRNNKLNSLPSEIKELRQLEYLNLSNNALETVPEILAYLMRLHFLYLFNNYIHFLPPALSLNLVHLETLNINRNQLSTLPPEIRGLKNLRNFYLDHNQIRDLPDEFCSLTKLEVLHVGYNRLQCLPTDFGLLAELKELHLQKNRLSELPESLSSCQKLKILDVAANRLRIFPARVTSMTLSELYYEKNPLLKLDPVTSQQEDEVLTLKEISARFASEELEEKSSIVSRSLPMYPNLQDILSQTSLCAVCRHPFLNIWLECVSFIPAYTVAKKPTSPVATIPVRALLCSYKCFNRSDHSFYGVVFP